MLRIFCFQLSMGLEKGFSSTSRPQLTSSDTTQYFIANYFIHLKEYIIVDKK